MISEIEFLDRYKCKRAYENSKNAGYGWSYFNAIAEAYADKAYDECKALVVEIVDLFNKGIPSNIRIVYGRAKDPEHLIEKIIRKIGEENSHKYRNLSISNYRQVITDLIGIRVLTLRREDWIDADNHLRKLFGDENIIESTAYICYGDRDIYNGKLKLEWSNKGYRSQHYIVKYNGNKVEIQVRTLAEEVYGEFDHAVRYPYRSDNKFLKRYNHIISKAVSELDDLISTCMELPDDELKKLDTIFEEDKYKEFDTVTSQMSEAEDKVFISDSRNIGELIRNKLILRRTVE